MGDEVVMLATGADAFPRFTFLAQTAASGFHLELVKLGLWVVWAVTAKVPKVVTLLGSIRCHKKPFILFVSKLRIKSQTRNTARPGQSAPL
jgi:hypothetical protein